MMSFVKSIESLDDAKKIIAIADKLEEEGFTIVYRRRKGKGLKNNIENIFYTKDGVDYVFCVIHKIKENVFYYTIMDYKIYENIIASNQDVIINWNERNMGDFKIVLRGGGYVNIPLHRLAIECTGLQVNHKTHNPCININEYLSACTAAQNLKDKSCYATISDDKKSFSFPLSTVSTEDSISLLSKGFSFKDRIYSPEYPSSKEMYSALDNFENKYLGAFRYNPLIDCVNTWYVLVVQKMLGSISDVDLYEYNRRYMIEHRADIAEYYQLAH